MAIVAAGMHHPRCLRGKGQPGLLGNGQGIHVCPQGNAGRACFPAAQTSDDTCPAHLFPAGNIQRPQVLGNKTRCGEFGKGKLRVPVEMAADIPHPGNLLTIGHGQDFHGEFIREFENNFTCDFASLRYFSLF